MNIEKRAVAGSLQSNDCLVEIAPLDHLEIELQSPLKDRFGTQMLDAAKTVIQEQQVTAGRVRITDKGALDCTIRARVKTAILRASQGDRP